MLNMMTATVAALAAKEVEQVFLYEVDINDSLTLRFAAYDENVSWGGNLYNRSAIKHSDMSAKASGEVEGVSLDVADQAGDLRGYVRATRLEGQPIRIIEIFPATGEGITTEFKIASITSKKGVLSFKLSMGFDVFRLTVPCRIAMSRHCRWIFHPDLDPAFAGTELDACRYTGGDTSCDKSYEDCLSKQNTDNFGGFPGIRSNWLQF